MIWTKIGLFRFILIGILCTFISVTITAQDLSNKGTDFWITYPAHIDDVNSTMGIYITSDVTATGTIYVAGTALAFSVSPNTVVTKFLGSNPSAAAPNTGVYLSQQDGIAFGKAIHVVSDNPIVVYAHIIKTHRSGASLILPSAVWGSKYIVPSYQNEGNSGSGSNEYGYGTITVVAKDTNTLVQITPKANSRVGLRIADTPYQITLAHPGDVYQVEFQQDADISGTIVESIATKGAGCKRIGVFSSSTWSAFGCNNPGSGDNLYQQLFPTGSWGKTFVTAPAKTRSSDIFRIFVEDTATNITVTESGVLKTLSKSTLQANSFYEYETGKPIYIQADKPVSVLQYFTTELCGGSIGDPVMVALNPIEQTINNITVFSAHKNWVPQGQSDITNCYLNIIIKSNAIGSFKINGSPPNGFFIGIPGTSYSYLQEDVSTRAASNPVQVLNADSNFIAIAYGFGDVESYGYNAGTNVKDFSQFLTIQNPFTSVFNNNTACTANPFHIGIVLPFPAVSMVWDFNNSTKITPNTVFTNNSPVPDSIFMSNGVKQYYYKLPATYKVSTTAIIPIVITVNNPTSDGCSGIQQINYNINISQSPTTSFTIKTTGCVSDPVLFTDNSAGNGTTLIQNNWDFGNGITAVSVADTALLYKTPGTYSVKLRTINSLGCYTDTTESVQLSAPPTPAFNLVRPACLNTTTLFTDQSTKGQGGNIVKWIWNFGNGSIDTVLQSTTVSAIYDTTMVDTVKLTIISSTGCTVTKSQLVTVNYSPNVNFILPEICLNDASGTFIDSSYIQDGTQSSFSYLWNFGDQNNPNTNASNAQNGVHKYSAVGNYNVSLRVTSNNGCVDSLTKAFTVNGSIPVANFNILNTGNLCSNLPVKIQNTSTVDFGNITQVEIYTDFINQPAQKLTYINPGFNKVFDISYNNFHQPLSQQFTIHFVAYSGISCVSSKDTVITVFATPEISYSIQPKKSICMNDSLKFSGYATGFTANIINNWTWNFGNQGSVNMQNTEYQFNDSGTIPVSVQAITTEGCYQSLSDTVIIYPAPSIKLPQSKIVLEGQPVILSPEYKGSNLSYLWQPATYLSSTIVADPVCTPHTDTLYTITATNQFMCSTTDSIMIRVLLTPLIPNVFSPNGDGINDFWHINHLSTYPKSTIEVFDRNGQRVFYSYNYDKEWDGTYNGSPVPIGTYYYIIQPKNGRQMITGSVTIIR